MPRDVVTNPIPGSAAFRATGDAAILSQAAILLMIGRQLRSDDQSLRARALAFTGQEPASEEEPDFPIPRLRPAAMRIRRTDAGKGLRERYGSTLLRTPTGEGPTQQFGDRLADITERLYADPDPVIAAQLMEGALRHPDELVRVAAAASYFPISAEPQRLVRILRHAVESVDELTHLVAVTTLARVEPENAKLRKLTRSKPPRRGGTPSHTSLIVHGTFAANDSWWAPGGEFHTYLKAQVRPDLYSANDRFGWSGGYSDSARAIAAGQLTNWVSARNLAGLDLFTHSHGGSVAMLATQAGLVVGELIMLSCPVHVPEYFPDFTKVTKKAVSIRVHLDLVILADFGGQRFHDPRITEHLLPIWFDHSATHYPSVWQANNIPAML